MPRVISMGIIWLLMEDFHRGEKRQLDKLAKKRIPGFSQLLSKDLISFLENFGLLIFVKPKERMFGIFKIINIWT